MQIRKGYEKYIDKVLIYLNKKEIDDEVVRFINSSNSKASKSYWILRTDLNEDEIKIKMKEYIDSFVKSAYKNTNRLQVSKDFVRKNHSRGYSGWVKVNEKNYYVRSQVEFVFLHYFHIIFKNYNIEMEHCVYYKENKTYKPDFFIFDNDKLIKIIEIKDSKKNADESKIHFFKDVFGKIDTDIYYNYKKILNEFPNIKDKLSKWKLSRNNMFSGKNNPMYNVKHTAKTKKKISEANKGNKSKFKGKTYEEIYGKEKAIELKNKLSICRKQEFLKKQIEKDKKDPIIEAVCVICGGVFNKRTLDIERKTCYKNGCTTKYNKIIGKPRKPLPKNSSFNSYKTKIIKVCSLLNDFDTIEELNDEIIKKIKEGVIKMKRFRISEQTLKKYFNTIEELKECINGKIN